MISLGVFPFWLCRLITSHHFLQSWNDKSECCCFSRNIFFKYETSLHKKHWNMFCFICFSLSILKHRPVSCLEFCCNKSVCLIAWLVWKVDQLIDMQGICVFYRQEGVEDGIYVPIEVNVHTQAGKVLTCRSYQMKDYVCGPPSPQYKKVGVASL